MIADGLQRELERQDVVIRPVSSVLTVSRSLSRHLDLRTRTSG